MIAKLKGTVESVDADSAVIDVNGVGYLVSASARTLRDLVVGGSATVLVETIVREDAIALYGFLETAERDWFRILTTVQGVGARVALSILSTLPPEDRSLILMVDLEGRSLEEISAVTGWGASKIKMRLFRVRGQLRKSMQKLEERK